MKTGPKPIGGRGTYKHQGTDFALSRGTNLCAAAPGYITAVVSDPNGGTDVWIKHLTSPFYTYLAHCSKILKDSGTVKRGETVALSGTDIGGENEVHLEVDRDFGNDSWEHPIDPFRDLFYTTKPHSDFANSISLWTKDNDPQYPLT